MLARGKGSFNIEAPVCPTMNKPEDQEPPNRHPSNEWAVWGIWCDPCHGSVCAGRLCRGRERRSPSKASRDRDRTLGKGRKQIERLHEILGLLQLLFDPLPSGVQPQSRLPVAAGLFRLGVLERFIAQPTLSLSQVPTFCGDALAARYGLGVLTSVTMVEGDPRYDGIWYNDVILTGTPAGVGPVARGDRLLGGVAGVGELALVLA